MGAIGESIHAHAPVQNVLSDVGIHRSILAATRQGWLSEEATKQPAALTMLQSAEAVAAMILYTPGVKHGT